MPFSYNPLLGVGLDKSIPLDGAGKIPSTFLPSYVDDVEEYNNLAAFPATGETGKIYVAINTGFVYRWSGSVYVQIGVTAAAGSTTQVQFNDGGAFGGDAGLVFDKTTDALTIAGPVVHPLGAAATPSLTFTGDPNTGIYSPGADQLAISTNGTGRLFVDANGNTHVNAVDGQLLLSRSGARSYQLRVTGAGGNEGLAIRDESGATEIARFTQNGYFTVGGLRIKGSDTQNSIYQSAAFGLSSDNYITIGTGASQAERLRIDSSGRVGLGTSSPRSQLNVSSNGATILTLENSGTALLENSVFGQIDFYANDASTNGTGAKCNIKAFTENATGNIAALTFSTSSSSSATGVERLRITGAGNVGIGTTTVDALLEVYSPTNGANLAKFSDAFNNRCLIVKGASGGVNLIAAEETNEASTGFGIAFSRGATEMGRFDGSGRLLVGTSTARQNWFNGTSLPPQVQIEGAGLGARLSIVRNDASANGHGLILGKTRGSSYEIVNAEDPVGYVSFQGADGAELVEAARIETVIDGTPGASDMPGRLVFSTTADGAASPTERLRITSAGVLQVADAGNITVGTTTGTKIGTATTQKIGFYNATPVVQPAAVADATDAATVITQLNDLLAKLRTLGIIAT